MKKLIVLALFITNLAYSQELRQLPCSSPHICQKNTIFHQTNSNFSNYNYNSINLEHLLSCSPTNMKGIRIGIIYLNLPKISSIGVPIELNFIYGRYSHLFEMGIGANYQYIYRNYNIDTKTKFVDKIDYFALNANIGYRYQNPEGGLFFSAGFTPQLSLMNYKKIPILSKNIFIPMMSFAFGWTFK